ncbi:MAG: hypothetical protein ABI744_00875 [Chloroflexota bacterium]
MAQPLAWLLAVGLGTILLVVWFVAVNKFMRVGAWSPTGAAREEK